jgi:hypothetical protein
VGIAFAQALAGATARDLRLKAAALTWFQIECVLFSICDYAFAGDLSFEAAYCAFNAFIIVNLYSCHSKPPSAFRPFIGNNLVEI